MSLLPGHTVLPPSKLGLIGSVRIQLKIFNEDPDSNILFIFTRLLDLAEVNQ